MNDRTVEVRIIRIPGSSFKTNVIPGKTTIGKVFSHNNIKLRDDQFLCLSDGIIKYTLEELSKRIVKREMEIFILQKIKANPGR